MKDVGEEFVLTLETADRICRRVHMNIEARRYVPDVEAFATARLRVELDYDLYINKLNEAVVAFLRELRRFALSVGKT